MQHWCILVCIMPRCGPAGAAAAAGGHARPLPRHRPHSPPIHPITVPPATMVAAAVCAAPVAAKATSFRSGKALRVSAVRPVRAARSALVCKAAVSAISAA